MDIFPVLVETGGRAELGNDYEGLLGQRLYRLRISGDGPLFLSGGSQLRSLRQTGAECVANDGEPAHEL